MADRVSQRSGSAIARVGVWLVALISLLLGLWSGHEIAYESGVPGSELGGASLVLGVGAVVVVLGLVGIGALIARSSRIAAWAFTGAGLLAVGTFGGAQMTGPLGLGYHEPLVLHAAGEATAELEGVASYVAAQAGNASCDSIGDSSDVGLVTALNLGELGTGTLRAILSVNPGAAAADLQLFIDGADLPEGATQPFWDGTVVLHGLAAGGASGSADFRNLPSAGGDIGKGTPGPAPSSGGWPAILSGTLHWQCHAY